MSDQNRREFLQTAGAAGAGFFVAAGLRGEDKPQKAGERLRIACIGVGGKGSSDTDQAGNHGDVVAICDIDDNFLAAKAKKFEKAKQYNDFRKLLEEMEKQIDAVVVSTPDHTHAPAAMLALQMGKHVYCQKPLTHSVHEARRLREVAREKKVCTQMGNQGTAANGLRESVELIQSGGLGNVTEVHVWTNRPVWPQAPKVTKRPEPTAVPKHVHWDLFLGPAPERPYAAGYHPFNWRGWWDYGTGALGDMACHTANMPFMALKLQYPTTVVGESGELNPETYPEWAKVTYTFTSPLSTTPVKVTWYEGRKDGKLVLPPEELLQGGTFSSSGALVVGDKATLYCADDYGSSRKLLGKDAADIKLPKPTLPRNNKGDDGMKWEWVEAIKKNDPSVALSNFDYAGVLTEFVLLGNIAIRRGGETLEWDGKAFKFKNSADATRLLSREYRTGWKL